MSFQIHVNQRTIYNTSCSRAKVAELADAPDLGSGAARRGGSSPPFRTKTCFKILRRASLAQDFGWRLKRRHDAST
jgi:hypothetical protein